MVDEKKPKKDGSPRKRRKTEDVADWHGIDGDLLRTLIATVTSHGGAIRFGYSRDGGAYSVGVYGDGKPFTEHRGCTEDIVGWLESFRDDYA